MRVFEGDRDASPPTYVIGHRNPDSDSVLSAIGYVALLRALHPERRFIAAAAGPVTAQTKYVLDRFGAAYPEVVHDLTPKAGSFRRERLVTIHEGDSIASALELYARHQFKAVPAVDDNGVCVGVLSLADVCGSFLRPRLEADLRAVTTTGVALARAVRGRFVGNARAVELKRRTLFVPAVSDAAFASLARRLTPTDWRDAIFVIGHRPALLRALLLHGAGVVIVSRAGRFSPGDGDGDGDESEGEDRDGDENCGFDASAVSSDSATLADLRAPTPEGENELRLDDSADLDALASASFMDELAAADREKGDEDAGLLAALGEEKGGGSLAELIATGASAVIVTPLAVVSATLLAKQSTPVAEYVDRDQTLRVPENARLSEVRARFRAAKHSHAVCVVDRATGAPVGVATRMDLLKARLLDVILVDHNEASQRVEGVGADGVSVVEVVDHHRLGAHATRRAIRLTVRPVGSTCTIVASLFWERGAPGALTPPVASLLLAGIMCDTLVLRSPTTTRADEVIAERLAALAGLRFQELGTAIFQATSPLANCPDLRALILADYKVYPLSEGDESGPRVGVAQIETTSLATLTPDLLARLLAALAGLAAEQQLWCLALLVTDVISSDSLLLCHGPAAIADVLGYPLLDDYDLVFELKGVVSRKKQLLPHLLRVLPPLAQ
ncbi:putative Manganese-dependent inorganic pyrophosphatase [Giardia muris]|uniref:inorganic diphosphatase n=1 Tax=Giardia muris TaxID=5742 RepID=A0A4Z1T5F5_GIAMU|nr:putative Manganese-dependent inorganic pyrophosphatase [Giardia muris]|eukprot:TNJ27701.1 putative Manganese-dependent inorganic pyrophosphatase [Giardia muris]